MTLNKNLIQNDIEDLVRDDQKGLLARLAESFPARNGFGTRLQWKLLCTLCLLSMLSAFFYFVFYSDSDTKVVSVVIGVVYLIKNLTEIWGQETPTWICPGNCCMFIVMYVLVIPWIVTVNGYCTMVVDLDIPSRGAVALVLYLFGSLYSLSYEIDRFDFKKQPENKGKLHTRYLAALSIHPNYFGDILTYTGWALAAGTRCSLSLPLMMVWTLVIIVVPNSDKYLADRYSNEFPSYAEATPTLIPLFKSQTGLKVLGWLCLLVSLYLQGTTCGSACGR